MLFWFALFGPLTFLLVSLILGAIKPNYSPKTDEISYLIYGKFGIVQTLNFLVCGVLSITLSFQLRGSGNSLYHGQQLAQMGACIFGLSLIMLRLFPTQEKGFKTYVSFVHKAIFVLSVLLQGTLQIMFANKNSSSGIAPYFYASGLTTIIGLVLMVYLRNVKGIAQRTLVAAIVLWLTVASLLVQ